MIEFVTSVNQSYHRLYGHRLCDSFLRYVEEPAKLIIYCDGTLEGLPGEPSEAYGNHGDGSRIELRDLGWVSGAQAYLENAKARVEDKMKTTLPDDPDARLKANNYFYRFDAVKFGKKGLAIADGLRTSSARYVFWCDADVIIEKPITQEFLIGLLDGASIACFQRSKPHTETGFIGFDKTASGMDIFTELYHSYWHDGKVFYLTGWTDCDVFDASVTEALHSGLVVRNLSTQPKGHVIAASQLGDYLDHQKGRRRLLGRSPEARR